MLSSSLAFCSSFTLSTSLHPSLRNTFSVRSSRPSPVTATTVPVARLDPRPPHPSYPPSPPPSKPIPSEPSPNAASLLRQVLLSVVAAVLTYLPVRYASSTALTQHAKTTVARAFPRATTLSRPSSAITRVKVPSRASSSAHDSHSLQGTSFTVAGTAAFLASALAVTVTHPIDTLKTMRQARSAASRNSKTTLRSLYRGVFSNILKEAPNAAIYLATYELFKAALMSFAPLAAVPLVAMCLAGMLGDALGSVVRVPAEIVNKRLQLQLSATWRDAVKDAFLTDAGVQSTVSAWAAVLWRDVPYGGLQIALYECVRVMLMRVGYSGLAFSVVAGAVAGLLASVVTTPADVLVTRLSTQPPQCYLETKRYMSASATFRRILREEGFSALWAGAMHRGMFYMPMIGLFFAAYEWFKCMIVKPTAVKALCCALLEKIVWMGGVVGGASSMPILLALVAATVNGVFGHERRCRRTEQL